MKATQLYRKHNGENSVTSLWRNSLLINMCLTYEDKASIKLVRQQKGWGTERICKEFPNKNWAVSSVKDLLRKIDKTNSSSDREFGGSQRHRVAYLLGQSRPTTDQQSHWSVATEIENCS